ncbi:hypothetical protein, unlikely [Trypanosoma brucei gambiense DAL972]|uniref:Uncharacterized protein n=1 Tax=Trypanosoma brucei gambiense (strain MHOM/CI/86/DAL972) TaxID=679716 RepID=C9ZPJ3_TRYB9|nr:hypothetical protein, unlikely [Trypanosoma brucei gambiense DAL972]CBH11321.1 hypothetical protein, unlikely [Trypanosoma brucei gambiense DAL972]|eukprot:XP_011773608.1 hypothetical protein, unlikely [Trypanosoma brucei gambiense DAL972]
MRLRLRVFCVLVRVECENLYGVQFIARYALIVCLIIFITYDVHCFFFYFLQRNYFVCSFGIVSLCIFITTFFLLLSQLKCTIFLHLSRSIVGGSEGQNGG